MFETKKELIALDPQSINRVLSKDEIIYIARTLGAYWGYNYHSALNGKVGMHAILKSQRHSDGFFFSKIFLKYFNIRKIMAQQLVLQFNRLGIIKPDWVAGIPDGATELGQEVAQIMGVKNAKMKKLNGRIGLVSLISSGETILLVEDFCTRGTAFKEAIVNIISKQPKVKILPYGLVILNRGGIKYIKIIGLDAFEIISVAEHRISDWEPEKCLLCQIGSISIKPKETAKNWELITSSQQ